MAERKKMSLTVKVILGLVFGLITGVIINNFFAKNAFVDTWLVNGLFHMVGQMFIQCPENAGCASCNVFFDLRSMRNW